MAARTSTRSRRKAAETPAETTEPQVEVTEEVAEAPAEGATALPEATEEAQAEATTKTPAAPAYRTAEGFDEAIKSLRALAKGNQTLRSAVQLVTHLAWKTPNGSVGWAKGTTPNVVSLADDLAIGVGTPIPQAMDLALQAIADEVTEEQEPAYAALSEIIRGHKAA